MLPSFQLSVGGAYGQWQCRFYLCVHPPSDSVSVSKGIEAIGEFRELLSSCGCFSPYEVAVRHRDFLGLSMLQGIGSLYHSHARPRFRRDKSCRVDTVHSCFRSPQPALTDVLLTCCNNSFKCGCDYAWKILFIIFCR